ncbi:histidine kinase [Pseudonocardia sp. NPDC049635]|uniref:sensor histidine kinase n=1 Tax=Pseudonocardia sp. NPDC049635 TaxID=3155506 RepID=UPI0033C9B2AF
MTPPTAVLPPEPAPGGPVRRTPTFLVTLEVLAYLFWLGVDVLAAATLPAARDVWYSGLLAGAGVAGVVLLRHRSTTAGIARVAVTALALSAALSLLAWPFGLPMISFTELFALAVVTVAVIRRSNGAAAVAYGIASFGVLIAVPALRFDDVDRPMALALVGLGWAGTVAVAAVLREMWVRREAGLAEARNTERMELARELHDVVAHHVTGIVVAAQAAVTVARTHPEQAGPALESIERAGAEALAGMRRMVGVLRGGEEAARAVAHGPADITELVSRFDPYGHRTVFQQDPALDPARLAPGVGATAYRVVQEALTNVHRHAPDATAVHVGLWLRDGRLEVVVRNEGGQADRRRQAGDRGGFGLAGMAERVGALGGTLRVGPDGPGAWLVLAELPAVGR